MGPAPLTMHLLRKHNDLNKPSCLFFLFAERSFHLRILTRSEPCGVMARIAGDPEGFARQFGLGGQL